MEIFEKIIDAIFPVYLVLLFFACFNSKKIKKTEAFRFLIITSVFIIIIRFVILFAGVKISSRYFYGLSVIAICFSVPGLFFMVKWLKKLVNIKIPGFSSKHAAVILLVTCSAICLGKGLRLFKPSSKQWIFESAEIVKNYSKDQKPVVVSNNPDRRAAYYAGADFVKFIVESDESTIRFDNNGNTLQVRPKFGMLAKAGRNEFVGKWIVIPGSNGLEDIEKTIRNINPASFLLMRMKDEDFRNKFNDAGSSFPFKLVKTMYDDKKREICLYLLKD